MEQDIRWKQRFDNFGKAYVSLQELLQQTEIDEDVRVDAAIKRFELVFVLAW